MLPKTLSSFRRVHYLLLFGLLGAAAFLCLRAVHWPARAATTLTVTTTADSGAGSLRQAIADAASGNTINFNLAGCPCTITLTSGELFINKSLTIRGAGAGQLAVSGNNASRVFYIDTGTVLMDALTVTGGNGTGTFVNGSGGGIFNFGVLTVTNSTVTGNSASNGSGGGIFNFGVLTVTNSTVTGNSASTGGGIFNNNTLTVTNSTVTGNSASGFVGGGIYNSLSLTLTNSTVSGNSAGTFGGGIYNLSTLTLSNSTITGNRADSNGDFTGTGGGITAAGNEFISNTIVAGNLMGAIASPTPHDIGGGSIDTPKNNIVANSASAGGVTNGVDGNIVGNGGIGSIDINTILNTTLAFNGGPTRTHALVPGSPALGAGSNALLPPDTLDLDGDSNTAETLPVDQRGVGFPRVANTNVDIGAFEVGGVSLVVNSTGDTFDGACTTAPGGCTLREAISTANALAGSDTITFDPSLTAGGATTITLTGGELLITSDTLTITGPDANLLTVSGNQVSRVFNIGGGVTAGISGLTIISGKVTGSSGGAIFIDVGAAVTITSSTLSGNSAGFNGGAIFNNGTLTITNSTLSGNSSSSSNGTGGAISSSVTGTLTLINSTISGNSSNFSGGGINAGTLTVTNSTISGNSAAANGGGIVASTLTLTNCTITGNRSDSDGNTFGNGGGIRGITGAGNETLTNTIVAGNFRGTGTTPDDINGSINAANNNLIGDAGSAGGVTHGTNGNIVGNSGAGTININTVLNTVLGSNGGPTRTHALVPNSPALNAGSNALLPVDTFDLDGDSNTAETIPVDQRGVGFPRVVSTTVDIGAYEVNGVLQTGPSLLVNSIADTFDGACTTEPGGCTLREAISTANTVAGANTITFDPALTAGGATVINLASALPDLSSDMTISGPGANLLAVNRNVATRFRIFSIPLGVTVNISGLTITKGFTDDGVGIGDFGGAGGGLHNSGTLSLANVAVSGNQTGKGADDNFFAGSGGFGGGIFNAASGVLTITNSTISGNQTGAGGSSFNPNNAGWGGFGGGIENRGTVTLSNSTISGNQTGVAGLGAIGGMGPVPSNGGGIDQNDGTMTISNCTITANTAQMAGGIRWFSGTITLRNTIVAGNVATNSRPNIFGTVQSDGYNLIGDPSGATINQNPGAGPDITNVDAKLGSLANNGGPTLTHALLPGSPAIDKGNSFSLVSDQRGQTRPFDNPSIPPATDGVNTGDNSDIGAYEVIGALQSGSPSFIVNSIADTNDFACTTEPGGCTLREVIHVANATAGANTITFDPALTAGGATTITLTGALPDLSSDININGPGANLQTVSGNGVTRVFNVTSGVTVVISGLTIANGNVTGFSGGLGGGIFNAGTLTITSCTISGNSVSGGTIGFGGIPVGNNFGGGILNNGTLTLTNSTLSGNSASGGFQSFGGAIFNNGSLTISNSTLFGNSTNTAPLSFGGAIYNNGTVTFNNSTLAGNSGSIGGIFNNSGATVNAGNTIIAGNTAADFTGTLNSQGHNLIGNTSGATITGNTTGNILNQDPLLGPLQNNGGPIMTRSLSCNSPARDAGSNALAAGLTTDQRGPGFPRVVNTTVDIGAFEVSICNQAPTAVADSYSTNQNTPLTVPAPGVLSNDSDPNAGDTLTAVLVSGPTNAQSFTLNPNGSFNYTPSNSFSGADSFTYKANDGTADSNTVTVSLTVAANNLRVNDAKVAEPNAGSVNMIFTVTLSAPAPASGVSVNFTTMDEVSAITHAKAGLDYTTNNGTLTFAAGEQFKTLSVPVLADNLGESNETFLVVLSNPVNATLADDTATGTIRILNLPGAVLISELRTTGPAGAGDEFVEISNNTNSPITVAASDASAGYGLFKMGADCNATPVLIGTIPNGTVIPARGHYLFVGSQYSLGDYGGTGAAVGDQTLSADIETDANVSLFSTAEVGNLSSDYRLDAVGFAANSVGNCNLLSEGTVLPSTGFTNLEGSYQRDQCGKLANSAAFGGCAVSGLLKDTNSNVADFFWADTVATNTPAGRHLGAPGPENLASPLVRNSTFAALIFDATQPSTLAPNRVRDLTAVPNGALGTLTIRRRYRNDTGGPVTRLRFRIVDISTFPTPVGVADLRALTSSDVLVNSNDPQTCTAFGSAAPCSVTVTGTTVEAPPAQLIGGGNNTTLTVTLGSPLPAGASINIQWRLGVQTSGSFKFIINVEALP